MQKLRHIAAWNKGDTICHTVDRLADEEIKRKKIPLPKDLQ